MLSLYGPPRFFFSLSPLYPTRLTDDVVPVIWEDQAPAVAGPGNTPAIAGFPFL